MYKKKLSTIAIITILTLSILIAAIPMASAIPIDVAVLDIITGPVGTKPTVTGATPSATPFGQVEVYWDTLGTKIDDGYADSAGAYSIKFTIPEGIVGTHYVIVKDVLSSTTASTTFTVTPEIDISTEKGLPGDSVTVEGTGFGDEVDVGIGLGAEVAETGEAVGTGDGSTKAFSLDYAPVKPASDTVYAPGIGSATFTTDGTTTLGTAITVTAPSITANFTAGLYDAAGTTELVAPAASTGDNTVADTVVLTYAYVASTAYTVKITFADETGSYTLADDGTPAGSGGPIAIADGAYTINYATGVITFTTAPASGVPITADYTRYTYGVTPVAGAETSDVGSFEVVTIIPAIPVGSYGDFDVTAVDEDGNTDTYVTLTVDYYVTVTPPAGPTGITITISGRIPASTPYELRIGTVTIATGTSEADTTFSRTYAIPALLSQGPHTVSVVWATVNTRSATFTVTAPPTLVLGATSGVAGAVVTISGAGFSGSANITLTIGTITVNSTALDSRFGPTSFGGTFSEEFTVPVLATGVYVLTILDEYGASTGTAYTFQVLPTPVTTVAINGASYYPCCTLSFSIVTSETNIGTITVTIRDPSGSIWWTTTGWTLTSGSVYYQDQLVNGNPIKLPLDAPLGSWNWTVTYTPASSGIPTKATGLFTVAAEPSQQDVLDQLTALETTLTTLITTTEGDIVAVLNTKSGQIMVELDAIDAKLQGIEDLGVVIATDVDDIQLELAALDLTVLDALGVQITAIEGDVATIKSNIGTVTTDVDTLDAKVTSLSGDVATVSTTLGTLTGTVTSIEGSIATIDTDVGTVEADIGAVQADVTEILEKPDVDMMPAWIAVVLSLVAAIAAVFAVITIRQKIAG